MKDEISKSTKKSIAKCLWKTDEFGNNPDMSKPKIYSEVATDDDRGEFFDILLTGKSDPKTQKSRYAVNYRLFQEQIKIFLDKFPAYFSYMTVRILNNCILLPINAESQDTALRIFSTLNDRGKPLSDSDIFKTQLYKSFSDKGKKDLFISQWKSLETTCEKIFHPSAITPLDEIFTRYMYYERAIQNIKESTTQGLRNFYEKNNYELLRSKSDKTFENLLLLADFWNDVENQNNSRFSDEILRQLFILNYAPNSVWTWLVSVYFMHNRKINDEKFYIFLKKIIAFIWAYSFTNPGVNSLRTPVFNEMINITKDIDVTFNSFKFDVNDLSKRLFMFKFNNNRPITKSMLAWWAMQNEKQEIPSLEVTFETEHIFAKNRLEDLKNKNNLEVLGNKSLLEKRINIRASDYKFSDKVKYYKGFKNSKGQLKQGTQIHELLELSENVQDFSENDIEQRNNKIIEGFLDFVIQNNLAK